MVNQFWFVNDDIPEAGVEDAAEALVRTAYESLCEAFKDLNLHVPTPDFADDKLFVAATM